VDLALVGLPVPDAELDAELLLDPELALVFARDAQQPADLSEMRLIFVGGCRCAEQWLRSRGHELHVVARTHSAAAAQALARRGLGTAVMPLYSVDATDELVVVERPESDWPRPRIGVAWHKRRGTGQAGARLRAALREVCDAAAGAATA
jgi:DNA-binding transcriptional LysR family regulator